jgi:hypothetical protein
VRADHRLDLPLLESELVTAGIAVTMLGTTGALETDDYEVWTFDTAGDLLDLPPAAQPVVDAHQAPPLVVEHAGVIPVDAIVRTTDASPLEVFRFPCAEQRLYEGTLVIRGIDAGTFAVKRMVGEFVWKRLAGNAIVVGITVVSDIHETAAAAWAPNCLPDGTDVVFTVAGVAGRTIDWYLSGTIGAYAPGGLAA